MTFFRRVILDLFNFISFYIRFKRCRREIKVLSQLFLVRSYRVKRRKDKFYCTLTMGDEVRSDGRVFKIADLDRTQVTRLFERLLSEQVIVHQEGEETALVPRFDKTKFIQTLFEISQKATSLINEYATRSALTQEALSRDCFFLELTRDLLVEECEFLSKESEKVVTFAK